MEGIKKELRAFLSENFIFAKRTDYSDDSPFFEMGILDSTGMLELLAFLEGRYGIALEDSELVPENLESINAVAQCVQRKLAGADADAAVAGDSRASA